MAISLPDPPPASKNGSSGNSRMASRSRMNTLGSKRRTGRRSCAIRPPCRRPFARSSRRKTPSPSGAGALRRLAKSARQGDARAHQGGRRRGASARSALSLLRPPQEGGQHPIFCRALRTRGAEEILLDGDAEGAGKIFFDIAEARHSPDHSKLAWSADDNGSELNAIRVRDLRLGADGADVVTDTDGSLVWSADSKQFYYVHVDEHHGR